MWGQGDGIVLSGKGKNYLIDGGSSDVKQAGAQRIEPYLLSEGIGCLDYVFVTHGDEDHISGIRELLEGQKLGVVLTRLCFLPKNIMMKKLGRSGAHSGRKRNACRFCENRSKYIWKRRKADRKKRFKRSDAVEMYRPDYGHTAGADKTKGGK